MSSSRKERTRVHVKISLAYLQTGAPPKKTVINSISETRTYLNSRHMEGAANEQTMLTS